MSFPQTITPTQVNKETPIVEMFASLKWASTYTNDPLNTSGLNRGYNGGRWGGFAVSDVTHTFGTSTTTYVSVALVDGALNFNTSSTNYNDDANYLKVETVVTGASAVTSTVDDRGGPGGVNGGAGSGGGSGDMVLADVQTVTGAKTFGAAGAVGKLKIAGNTSGAATLDAPAVAGTAVVTLPGVTGTLATLAGTETLTNKTLTNAIVGTQSPGDNSTKAASTAYVDAAVTGGGGLTNFTEAANSSSPNASVPVVSLTATNAAADVDVAIVPKGTNGSLLTAVPDSTSTGGNKRGNAAIDLQLSRVASTQVASGNNSIAIGRKNTASLAAAIAIGDTSTASGVNAVAIGSSNTASAQGAVAIGSSTGTSATQVGAVSIGGIGGSASGAHAVKLGGNSTTASGTESATLGGESNTASGTASACIGGQNNFASGAHSVAFGYAAHTRGMYACIAQGVQNIATAEDIQAHRLVLGKQTTNATQATLVADGGAVSAANQLMLSNTSARTVFGTITALQGSTGDAAGWTFACVVKRGANAAATALVGSATVTQIAADAGASTWAVSITVDTTNGTLAVKVTGEAAKTIKWTAVLTAGYVG